MKRFLWLALSLFIVAGANAQEPTPAEQLGWKLAVHSYTFRRFPIDVAFVDRQGTVIRRIDGLRPWRATRIHANARACVELAAGTLAAAGVKEGTRLALVAPPSLSGSPGAGASDGASVS